MEYDNEILDQVKELTSLYMTIDEIAMALDLDPVRFRREVRHKKTDLAKAYLKGKLETTIAVRRQIVEFAKKGSPQAEAFVKEYQERQEGAE